MSNVNTINANGAWYPIEDETARDNITSLENKVTDLTNQIDQLNSALAELDTSITSVKNSIPEIQTGETSSFSCAAGAYTELDVTFKKTFSSRPNVVITNRSTSTGLGMGNVAFMTANVSTTGFTIRVCNNDSSSRTPIIDWIAMC